MAPIIKGCCCFDTLETGSRASAYFTVVTGIINIIIDIWFLIKLHWFENNLEPNQKWAFLPPGLLVLMYLELACNIGMILVGLCLMVGMNRGYHGESMIRTWKIGVIFFRFYEFLLGVYIMAWVGGHRITDIIYMAQELILVAFYWTLDTVLLIAAVICVTSYWDEILDSVYGRERRTKFFTMLTNLRSAATGRRPGTATPSAYSYTAMSRSTLGMSHVSLPVSHSSGYPQQQQQQQQYGPGYPQRGGPMPQGAQAGYPPQGYPSQVYKQGPPPKF